jgi:hypothetical protein
MFFGRMLCCRKLQVHRSDGRQGLVGAAGALRALGVEVACM